MEGLGTGTLIKFSGAALALLCMVLAAIGTTSTGLFALYGVMALVGAGGFKLGAHLEKRQAATSTQRNEQQQ